METVICSSELGVLCDLARDIPRPNGAREAHPTKTSELGVLGVLGVLGGRNIRIRESSNPGKFAQAARNFMLYNAKYAKLSFGRV